MPRKKAKFLNFLKNSLKIRDEGSSQEIWAIFESVTKANAQETPKTPRKAAKEAPKIETTPGKPWWEQFTEKDKKVYYFEATIAHVLITHTPTEQGPPEYGPLCPD